MTLRDKLVALAESTTSDQYLAGVSTFVAIEAARMALEEAARECDQADKSTHPADLADRIRALAASLDAG